jgi:hypothetical protein
MPDKPIVDMERAASLVRKQMVGDEDFVDGQSVIEARRGLGRALTVNGRPVRGMDEDFFDGETALADTKARLESMKEKREASLQKRRG